MLATAATGGRLAGSVFQWGGTAWEYRAPQNYSSLYINCFKDGLEVPALAQDIGWFGGVFAALLVAQKGFIEELESQIITLKQGGVIQSETSTNGERDILIKADGEVFLNKATIRGRIEANEGYIENMTAINLKTDGTLNGARITEYARNHPASPLGDMDYPIGSIILVKGSYPYINQETNIYIGGQYLDLRNYHYTSEIPNDGYQYYKLPGRWVSSGGAEVSYVPGIKYFLARRIS